jgi:hypothetical protein
MRSQKPLNRFRRLTSKAIGLSGACLAIAALSSSAARADFDITEFTGATSIGGEFSRQAGAHPNLTTTLRFSETGARTAIVGLPPGITADPTSAATCTSEQLVAGENGKSPICPVTSQVGFADVFGGYPAAVYNMERPPGLPGLLAFNSAGVVIKIRPYVRSADYGITSTVDSISQALAITGTRLTLWGVPSDPSNDGERFSKGGPIEGGLPGASSDAPRVPFITNPTSCSGAPLVTTAEADSWWEPGLFSKATFDSDSDGTPFITDGCERLPFEPSMKLRPASHRAAAPTGLNVHIAVPQSPDPYGLATAQVRRTVVTLPKGMSVSTSAAQGLEGCALSQIKLGSEEAPVCPPSSSIGTVKIDTPLLDDPLEGEVIVAKQQDNPFNSLLALYLVVEGPGVLLKLPGRVDLDPQSGQLTTTFDNTPQLPFSTLDLSLRSGPAAPLVAPSTCGTYTAHAEMTSWASDTPVSIDAPMLINEGCATGGFSPILRAGAINPVGGEFSPFTLQVTRNDGEQNVARVDGTLPPGQLAKLAGVPLCGEAGAASGDCPSSSQIGTTTVGAGAGPLPIYVPEAGRPPTAIYLAGPYRGAPYSIVVKVPAQAGPFDLGIVTVRSAVAIDPSTAQVSVKSDPLPQILQGIPVAYRDVRVDVNRPDFMLNPTSCDPMRVNGTILSDRGAEAKVSSRYQVAGCRALGFAPKLHLRFSGPTHRNAYPKLRATLTMPKDGANIDKAVVTLPKTEFLENAHIQTICTRVQYRADACPAKSVYGYAKAWTPLLDKPLQGPVYLRSSNHELPDLVASLDGQIHVDLAGRIDSVHERIRNTFWAVPDAPVSKFVLTMQGGKKGLLVNNTELCETTPRANAKFDAQNGKTHDFNSVVKTDCGKKGKK